MHFKKIVANIIFACNKYFLKRALKKYLLIWSHLGFFKKYFAKCNVHQIEKLGRF